MNRSHLDNIIAEVTIIARDYKIKRIGLCPQEFEVVRRYLGIYPCSGSEFEFMGSIIYKALL